MARTNQKKIITKSTVTDVDFQTGEIKSESTSETYRLPSEPKFIKLYVDDIGSIIGLSGTQKNILLRMLRKLDFEDGIVTLSARSRKLIAQDLNISEGSFRNALSKMAKTEIIKAIGHNEYEINPHYFAMGSWQEIYNRRLDFSLKVKYSQDGKKEIQTCIEEVQEELKFN